MPQSQGLMMDVMLESALDGWRYPGLLLSMEFSRQKYLGGLPFFSRDRLDPGN